MILQVWMIWIVVVVHVKGHGRLLDPPQRSSMWRAGYKVPINYDDNGLFCGGMNNQWSINGGRCGECGDPYQQKRPRPNEEGGLYGTGTIGRTFIAGQVIVAKVELTQSHMGFFQFKLCKKETKEELTTQHCLDKNILQLENGSGNKYYVQDPRPGMHYPRIQLPKNLVCENCVLQWHYTAGKSRLVL
ncbi:hypothetical protein QYM36_016783 [Artemia franciscana]|uniref:Chitin-binding type-4 domain-containing protein n=1 Tax=Artemia franciscana TaxID=6661 RepID=A0AA88KW66_ARTSF|nr:hypothetical protein QYM36_016783 [Artemia franciscana]